MTETTKMTLTAEHRRTLDLIETSLNNMSNEEFLNMHRSVEKGIGPTVDEFIQMMPYFASGVADSD